MTARRRTKEEKQNGNTCLHKHLSSELEHSETHFQGQTSVGWWGGGLATQAGSIQSED